MSKAPSFLDMIKAAKNMQQQMSSAKGALKDAQVTGKSGDIEIITDGLHNPIEVKGAGELGPDILQALEQINKEIHALSEKQIQAMSSGISLDDPKDQDESS